MKKGQNDNRIRNDRLGMAAIAFVAFVFLVYILMASRDLTIELADYEAKVAQIQADIEDEKARTEEIDALKEYMQTDAYAEEVAREKFRMVKSNEIVFLEED